MTLLRLRPLLRLGDGALKYLAVASLPTLASMLWYVHATGDVRVMLQSIVTPTFVHDVGWLALCRDAWYCLTANRNLPGTFPQTAMRVGTLWFEVAWGAFVVTWFVWYRHRPLTATVLAAPMLLFLCLAPGGAVEFFLLPLPFLVLANNWKVYTVGAVLGWFGCVLQYHLGMLVVPWTHDCVVNIAEPLRFAVVAWCAVLTLCSWGCCWYALLAHDRR